VPRTKASHFASEPSEAKPFVHLCFASKTLVLFVPSSCSLCYLFFKTLFRVPQTKAFLTQLDRFLCYFRQHKHNCMKVRNMAEVFANGEQIDILFWVGCAGSFDARAQKITQAFATILDKTGMSWAILGKEEMCTGDPARRAGNEFLFQMMAYNNIHMLNNYGIKKIVTTCPHCFNTLKNEYPELGGNYEVIHHTTLLQDLINDGKIKLTDAASFKGKKITYHDSCYLGRANNIYEAPRKVLEALDAELVEMKRCRTNGLCCGAGGAQMFKEEEKGISRVNQERTKEALALQPDIIAAACPFCNTMMSDGVKENEKEGSVQVLDIAEIVASAL
jgi:heterodisulfide reductase subunit D